MARFLYILTHSTEAPDRAATGLATALAAQRAGHDVDLWLTGEGIRLGVRGVGSTFNEPLPESVAAMIEALLAGGAAFHLEALSFARRKFADDAVLEGAVVADAARLAELVVEGRTPVTL